MDEPFKRDFADAKARLEHIAQAVASDDMPLDEALDLFEEAVSLGMQISDALETDLDESELVEAQEDELSSDKSQASTNRPAND